VELRDTLVGRDRASLEVVIQRVLRSTGRP
jgi:hypothetical protein